MGFGGVAPWLQGCPHALIVEEEGVEKGGPGDSAEGATLQPAVHLPSPLMPRCQAGEEAEEGGERFVGVARVVLPHKGHKGGEG